MLEESLRWLDVQGKTQQVERLIKKAAKRNGVDPATALLVYKEESKKMLTSLPVSTKSFESRAENNLDIHQVPVSKLGDLL